MADGTKIEWADASWSPVTGCDPDDGGQSEACANCYARRMAKRLAGRFGYPEAPDEFKVTLHPDRLAYASAWKKPRRIFVVSMGDLFHEDVPFRFIERVFIEMGYADWHTYMLLTKRPHRMLGYFEWLANLGHASRHPLPNVWLGVTAETEPRWRERVGILRQIPAAVRYISGEPLLSEILVGRGGLTDIDWVIVGAETGPGARYMDPAWARSIRDQCQAARVPFFFKRMSGGEETPADLMIREFPEEAQP